MGNYDGPSFYKQKHPKIKSLKEPHRTKKRKTNYALPKNVRTRDDLRDEASDPPPQRYPFKNKHIPDSLQQLDGWGKPKPDQTLLSQIEARLDKAAHTYLLFEEHLSDEMTERLEAMASVSRQTEKAKDEKPASKEKEKVAQVRKVQKEVMKPSTGLHRSLSNIIAEEQKGIEKSQLNSLFERNK